MLYDVYLITKHVRRRRVLAVNSETRVLKRMNPAKVRVAL